MNTASHGLRCGQELAIIYFRYVHCKSTKHYYTLDLPQHGNMTTTFCKKGNGQT